MYVWDMYVEACYICMRYVYMDECTMPCYICMWYIYRYMDTMYVWDIYIVNVCWHAMYVWDIYIVNVCWHAMYVWDMYVAKWLMCKVRP